MMDYSELPLKQNAVNFLGSEGIKESEAKITRKIEFDKGVPLSFDFETNEVKTLDYNINKFLLFSFKKILSSPLNVVVLLLGLLFTCVYVFLPKESLKMGISVTLYFHLVLIMFELVCDLYNFLRIYKNDKRTNSQSCFIWDGAHKTFVEATWADIRVGHILKVSKNEVVPADMILLETMESSHTCYVDVSAITGVFDSFIVKKACSDTQTPTIKSVKFNEYVKNIKGMLKYEEANSNIHSFTGRLKLESFPRASDVGEDNFVMRGATIKDVKCVYGMVVYTGMESKIMQILKSDKEKKFNYILKEGRDVFQSAYSYIHFLIILVYLLLIGLLVLNLIHKLYLESQMKWNINHFYKETFQAHSHFEDFVLVLINYTLTFHLISPFCLFSLITFAFYIFSVFLQWDAKVRLKSHYSVDVINNKSLPDFGKVKYILTDKTGTLTSRKFTLRACSVLGRVFKFDPIEKGDENFIFRVKNYAFSDLELYKEFKKDTLMSSYIRAFFEYICLCHSGKLRTKNYSSSRPEKVFSSSIAEENAVVQMMKNFGYHVETIKKDRMILKIENNTKIIYTVGMNNYSDKRKRMSVITKKYANDSESLLICKGHDLSIFRLIKEDDNKETSTHSNGNKDDSFDFSSRQNINALIEQIKKFSALGYRYTIYCKRRLTEDETLSFMTKYKSAENYVLNRDTHFENLANEFECDLEYMGVLFFEEKSSDDLRFCLSRLKSADVHVWIVSGDRKENVVSAAKSLDLFQKDSVTVELSENDELDDLDIKLNMNLLHLLGGGGHMMKMKTRQGVNINVETTTTNNKNRKLTILIHGSCFGVIHNDARLFQCFVTLLTFTEELFAYSFTPHHKFLLCQTVKKFVTKNSKVLGIGDGLNDFMMLKEADLSIGIRSREILAVRNTCDVIVTKFSQITDLILVHGSWNSKRIYSIAFFSLYANVLVIFPFFLMQIPKLESHIEVVVSYYKLTFDILVINLLIIFAFANDKFVDRSFITLNPEIYRTNFDNRKKIVYSFLKYTAKGLTDGIITYFTFISLNQPINVLGENLDGELFQYCVLHTCYFIISFKMIFLKLNDVSVLTLSLFILTAGLITGFVGLSQDIYIVSLQSFSYLSLILTSFLIIGTTFIYEKTLHVLNDLFNPKLHHLMNIAMQKIINNYYLFTDFNYVRDNISKINNSVKFHIHKITYEGVLKRLFKNTNSIDNVLENMTDINNNRVITLKISKPMLKFNDDKYENDYLNNQTSNLMTTYSIYLVLMLIFWLLDLIIESVNDRLSQEKVSKIIKIISILSGFILLLKSLKQNFLQKFCVYFYTLIIFEIISIYVEKENNDTKLCFNMILLFSYPLSFANRKFSIMITGGIFYLLSTTPAIFINGFLSYNSNFDLYSNLPLLYHRSIFIISIILVIAIYGYYEELTSRLSFMKHQKRTSEYKKDWEIYSNLVPEFVRDKMKDGLRGATAVEYEYVTILFCDIQDFDSLSANMSAKDMIYLLDRVYNTFDSLCTLHGLQKIETVGKTYLAAGGLKETEKEFDPSLLVRHHALRAFELASDMMDNIQKMTLENGDTLKLKIGLHSGKVIAAVVGNHKPQFSLIGDTINTTARMCAYSQEMAVNCSQSTFDHIRREYNDCTISQKEVKGKGNMKLYLFKFRTTNPRESFIIQGSRRNFSASKIRSGGVNPLNPKQNIHRHNPQISNNENNNSSIFIIDSSGERNSEDEMDQTAKVRKNTGLSRMMTKITHDKRNAPTSSNFTAKGSFLLLKFSNAVMKDLYDRMANIKFHNCKIKAHKLHFLYVFTMLSGMYNFSANYTRFDYLTYIFITLKAVLLSCLVLLTNEISKLISNKPKFLQFSTFFIFILLSVTIQVQMNYLEEFYLTNLMLEQNLTILTATYSGILSYRQCAGNLMLHIMMFITNLCINRDKYLFIKYLLFEIFLCCQIFIFSFRREFTATFDYIQSREEIDKLRNMEKLLFNLMPQHVVQNLKEDIPVADVIHNVTMLFADIVKFTDYSSQREPFEVVKMLTELFREFDLACEKYNVYKVHTIGDCYVVMSFTGKVPMNDRNYAEEARNVISMGETMIETIKEGTVIAGIIGTKVVRYDIFGSDVLIANKMESGGEVGKICISEDTKKLIETPQDGRKTSGVKYQYEYNKPISVSSVKREIKSYFIETKYERLDSD